MVYQFSLAPLLLYSYVFGDASYLTTWAARLEPPPAGATFLNFLASHDGIGLRPLEGLVPEAGVSRLVKAMHERGGFVTLRQTADGQKPYEINIALFSAFGGERHNLNAYLGAHTLLLSFQGIPAVYVHSLLASRNDLDLVEQTGRTRSINRGHWSLQELELLLDDEQSVQAKTLAHFTRISRCREAQPAFSLEAAQKIFPSPPGVFAMAREHPQQAILVIASVIDKPQHVPLGGIGLQSGRYQDQLTQTYVEISEELLLKPYEVLWLQTHPN